MFGLFVQVQQFNESHVFLVEQRTGVDIFVIVESFARPGSHLCSVHFLSNQPGRFEMRSAQRVMKIFTGMEEDVDTAQIDELDQAHNTQTKSESGLDGGIDSDL